MFNCRRPRVTVIQSQAIVELAASGEHWTGGDTDVCLECEPLHFQRIDCFLKLDRLQAGIERRRFYRYSVSWFGHSVERKTQRFERAGCNDDFIRIVATTMAIAALIIRMNATMMKASPPVSRMAS